MHNTWKKQKTWGLGSDLNSVGSWREQSLKDIKLRFQTGFGALAFVVLVVDLWVVLWVCFVLSVQRESSAVNTQPGYADGSEVADFPTCFAADALPVI